MITQPREFVHVSIRELLESVLKEFESKINGDGTKLLAVLPAANVKINCVKAEMTQLLTLLLEIAFEVHGQEQKRVSLDVFDLVQIVEIEVRDGRSGTQANANKLQKAHELASAHQGKLSIERTPTEIVYSLQLPKDPEEHNSFTIGC